jgi:hypothetical protein
LRKPEDGTKLAKQKPSRSRLLNLKALKGKKPQERKLFKH